MVSPQTQKIEALIAPSLDAMGYDIVRVQLSTGKKRSTLQIMIDRKDGKAVEIDDCSAVSHQVSALLDVEDAIIEAYNLEVSSPGIDRPLTRFRDFTDWQGFEAKIETDEMIEGRRRFKGILKGMDNNNVLITVDQQDYAVPFAAIQKAQLVLTDALIKETQQRYKQGE